MAFVSYTAKQWPSRAQKRDFYLAIQYQCPPSLANLPPTLSALPFAFLFHLFFLLLLLGLESGGAGAFCWQLSFKRRPDNASRWVWNAALLWLSANGVCKEDTAHVFRLLLVASFPTRFASLALPSLSPAASDS